MFLRHVLDPTHVPGACSSIELRVRSTPSRECALIERQSARRTEFKMGRDQRLGSVTSRCLARMTADTGRCEVGAPARPPATECIANAIALDQVIGAIGDSAMRWFLGCSRLVAESNLHSRD